MKVFTPYEGFDVDVETLRRCDACTHRPCKEARDRLVGAFREPKCGKALYGSLGNDFGRYLEGKWHVVTCTLPADHDGPHADETLQGEWK